MLALIQLSIEGGDPFFGRRFLIYATNSFILAGLAAALTVAVALILAYALRLHATAAIRGAVRVASLGYAIPGSVIAVGGTRSENPPNDDIILLRLSEGDAQ